MIGGLSRFAPPRLVLIDFQREYVTPGRPLVIAQPEPALTNARRLLAHARARGWLIAHCLLRRTSGLFAARSQFARPIDGYQPDNADAVFLRESFSVFSHPDFAGWLGEDAFAPVVFAGLGAQFGLLASILHDPTVHRALLVVEDAIAVAGLEEATAATLFTATRATIRALRPTATTKSVCAGAAAIAPGDGVLIYREGA